MNILDKLMERATCNQPLDRDRLFRPHMVYRLLKEPFGIWCDYHAPKEEACGEESKYEQLRMQQGVEFENKWVKDNCQEALKIQPEFGLEALMNSIKAMIDGVPVIHAPQLWSLGDEIYGKADLLVRSDEAGSDLGDYHYRVKEIKRSNRLQEYQVLQAALYNWILGKIQGYTHQGLTVVLKEGEETVSYDSVTSKMEDVLTKWRKIRDGEFTPEPDGLDKTSSPWRIYANKIVRESNDLTLLPDVGPSGRASIKEKLGISRIDQLHAFTLDHLIQIFKENTGASLYYHVQAYRNHGPILAPGAKFEIPRNKRHIYFDFETSDEVHPTEPAHVYLIGAWDGDQNRFFYFLGRGVQDEERIFNEFIEYAGNLNDCCLYHWTDFEIGVMTEVAEKYPSLREKIHRLIKSCVDLKEVIKNQVYLPVPSYSIKSVAPALGFHWRHKNVGAFESMAMYWDFLKTGDDAIIKRAVDYNEDDCYAMFHADKTLCDIFGIPFF